MSDETTRLDETRPGGDYLAADGKTRVDAWGKPIEPAASEDEDEKTEPKRTTRKAKGEG